MRRMASSRSPAIAAWFPGVAGRGRRAPVAARRRARGRRRAAVLLRRPLLRPRSSRAPTRARARGALVFGCPAIAARRSSRSASTSSCRCGSGPTLVSGREVSRFRDRQHSLAVTAPHPRRLVGLLEPLRGELANRLEHEKAILAELPSATPQKALVEQRLESGADLHRRRPRRFPRCSRPRRRTGVRRVPARRRTAGRSSRRSWCATSRDADRRRGRRRRSRRQPSRSSSASGERSLVRAAASSSASGSRSSRRRDR